MDEFSHLEIPLELVKAATNNFTDKPIGYGGFGAVYKGELLLPTGPRTVAIKRLDPKSMQGDVEFWKEILMLYDLEHKNLASLLHFCKEGNERILVYEYASGGSLDKHLDEPSLTYVDRLKISIGAAKGIAYLHDPKINTQQQRVLHRDIKSSNILLDEGTAKVSDLGLSKYGPANQAHTYVVSNVVGTPGYIDPMYMETGILSKESDVYSFGVVLLEVICGKLCYKYDKDGGLVNAWKKCCDEDRLDDIIFPDLMKQQMDQESLWTYVTTAKRCLNRNRKDRPTMAVVVKELEVSLHLQQNSKHDNANPTKMPTSYKFMEEFNHLRIGLGDIQLATNNFSDDNLLYDFLYLCSWFGKKYKGELSRPGGKDKVILWRFNRSIRSENDEFWNMVSLLHKDKHFDMVSSLKFCCEGDEMILVYNSQSYYSVLDMYRDSYERFSWTHQLEVKLEDCRALTNLEHFPPNQPQTFPTSRANLSEKSDVYSFGAGLFEMLQDIIPIEYRNGDTSSFARKWRRYYDTKRVEEIIFPGLKNQIDSSSLNTYLSIAYRCVNEDPKERPTLAEILKELEKALKLQVAFEEKLKNENPEKLKDENPKILNNSQFQNSWPLFKGVHMLETASTTC